MGIYEGLFPLFAEVERNGGVQRRFKTEGENDDLMYALACNIGLG